MVAEMGGSGPGSLKRAKLYCQTFSFCFLEIWLEIWGGGGLSSVTQPTHCYDFQNYEIKSSCFLDELPSLGFLCHSNRK